MPKDTEIDNTEETETEETEVEETDESEDEEFDAERARKKISKANREAKNLRERLKKFEEAEAARKDAEKSELEKAAERAEAAEKRAAALELNALRNEVALSKGLTAAQAKRLQGTTKEELEEDADDLLETFGASKESTSKRKATTLRGGSNPDEDKKPFDAKSLAKKMLES